ncbi:hypothetical protein [Streptomyces sp. NPDC058964]|uniref:hypothetical protein n=1 Tax=Streptomyces sp. NPDC058964 TaxID=3346681 RepID=UPI0036AB484F
MNPDRTPEELAARIASLSVRAPADRIDVDEAVRAGRRRRRGRRLAVAGVFACVVALAVSVAVVTRAAHDTGDTAAGPVFDAAAVTPEDLRGRWIAVRVDGHDVSAWRDLSGIPANIVIGADGKPNAWQVNNPCGPMTGGGFTMGADGSFTAPHPPRRFQPCPMLRTQAPDLADAVARTAHVTVDTPGDPAARTLRFLDTRKRLVAVWREDTTTGSRASMTSLCEKALGRGYASDGTFTTVERIRAKRLAATDAGPDDILPDVPDGMVAVHCPATGTGSRVVYAVTADGHKVRLRRTG